ncbi:MAG TPA: hypothetical protein VIY54_10525 [Steroidobacteraceae bacterium]
MATLTLLRARGARLDHAHSIYVFAAVARYRAKAAHALALARDARSRGNEPLALGLCDEAAAYHSMAAGLADQSRITEGACHE